MLYTETVAVFTFAAIGGKTVYFENGLGSIFWVALEAMQFQLLHYCWFSAFSFSVLGKLIFFPKKMIY